MSSYSIKPTIGILGGASNVATGHMYARINALSHGLLNGPEGGYHIVQTLIAGMDFGVIRHAGRHGNWNNLSNYVESHLERLACADLIICGSNTLHKIVSPLMDSRGQAFLHIADPTAEAIKGAGLSRVALFGTKSVMSADFMAARYRKLGVDIIIPTAAEQDAIDHIIFQELCKSEIWPKSRRTYIDIANRLAREAGVEGVILGCTEIETLLKPEHIPGVPLFDTMELLCQAAVKAVLTKQVLAKAVPA